MGRTYCGNRGIWVIDWGGDRNVLYDHLLQANKAHEFIFRLVESRHLIYRSRRVEVLQLARSCAKIGQTRIRYSGF